MTQELAFLNSETTTMPAFLVDSVDKNLGNENIGAEDQSMPQLKLLQALSPEIEELEGAKTGLFCNSITGELYESVYLVNLAYKREYAVFRKRQKGGGFHGSFSERSEAVASLSELQGIDTDYDIVETGKHGCLLLDAVTGEPKLPVMVFFKSTALPVSRNWNTQITTVAGDAPRFGTIWHVSSNKQSNEKGTWANWKVDHAGFVTQEIYDAAKELHAGIAAQM
tara:strand:- start:8063 stop:8734 length:672 start_codon:yes stop_codon:yes gene_type:complete